MVKFLLNLPGTKFILAEKFSRDPLETFFGHKTSKEPGHNDNPTQCKRFAPILLHGNLKHTKRLYASSLT